ncbi:type-F conjugative transfer system pilin acetylase TraX [Escherichia coli]|nr:type-F conjugative transfer system pilin acetylase TraX [Escherichia coli]
MISLPAGSRIWLVAGITDMRNGFNGLASKVQNVLKDDPFSGHLFIFRGRRGDQIKVLWADSDGLCLFTKRLERGRFVWPVTRDLAMWLPFSGTSYGIAGLLMLAVSHRLYRAEDRMERLTLVACLLAVIPALNLATSDAAAVAGLVMTVLTVGLVSCAGKSLPRFWPGDFFPTFYACHLAVLGVLAL